MSIPISQFIPHLHPGKHKFAFYTHTHTEGYYSAIKKDEILLFVTTWMGLESIRQNSVSQIKTNIL